MPYDHTTKAGNAGDVWKHYILLCVAEGIQRQHTGEADFLYVETHCGQGVYPLLPEGAWQQGVGRLTHSPEYLQQERYSRYVLEALKNNLYYGSWQLVARLMNEKAQASQLILADNAESVKRHIQGLALAPNIHFKRINGFQLLSRIKQADLVLIDPPYSEKRSDDFQQAERAAEKLLERGIPHLIWYPLTKEAPDHFDGHVKLEVHWSPSADRMQGCGMAMNTNLYNHVKPKLGQLEALRLLLTK